MPGYQLQSKRSLICLKGGRWSHFPPTCESILLFIIKFFCVLATQCSSLKIQDAQLSCTVSSYKFGGIARCFCKSTEFRLIGDASLHCGFDGKWSNKLAKCRGKNFFLIFSFINYLFRNYM